MALLMSAMTFTSCSDDDDKNNDETVFNVTETTPLVDDDTKTPFRFHMVDEQNDRSPKMEVVH